VIAEAEEQGSSATGRSDLNIGPKNRNGLYPFALKVKATTDVGLLTPAASSFATGSDPQFVLSKGLFGATLSLDPGSSIFASRPGVDKASAFFELTAPTLSQPLASITLEAVAGQVTASVNFAADPRLEFFVPGTTTPVSASQVESLLDGNSALGSVTGLTNSLALFQYEFDLSNTSLPPDAAFGSTATDSSFSPGGSSVPEPPGFVLFVLGMAGFVFVCHPERWLG
jgi:hypothetical protein